MTSHYQKLLDEAMNSFQHKRDRLAETRAHVSSVTNTVTSARREVSATVGGNGELTALSFPTSSYKRMMPTELATVITETIAEARQKSIDASMDAMAPVMPAGMSARDLMSGKMDIAAWFAGRVPDLGEDEQS